MKAVIFDLDGTLVDTLADLTESMNFALASLGQPTHTAPVIRQFIGDGVFTFASRALAENAQNLVGEVVTRMRQHYRNNCLRQTAAYAGIPEALAELRGRGIKLSVLTNKDQEVSCRIVEHCIGAGVFYKVVGVTDKTPVKPGTAAITKLMAEMKARPSECVLVGDSAVDIETARSAGVKSIGASWGFRGRQELEKCGADYIAESPSELVEIVKLTLG